MKPLLVASVYGPTHRNKTWYRLHRQFLDRTTPVPYDYAVVLNNVPSSFLDKDVIVIKSLDNNYGHITGIPLILDYFKSVQYEQYLILDTDCFPVWDDWYGILLRQMERCGKQYAAPARIEVLDTYPHPCGFFSTAEGVQSLDFKTRTDMNLLGEELEDNLFCEVSFYPLLRSNVYSPHPVFASIYNHLFYHHGAGTRIHHHQALTRSIACGYFDHYTAGDRHRKIEQQLFNNLRRDADAFIDRLLGKSEPTIVAPANGHVQDAARRGNFLSRLFAGK